MERIKKLLEQVITSAKIQGHEDVELCAMVLLGSIEKDCVCELADKCEEFTTEKVQEILFLEQVEEMIKFN